MAEQSQERGRVSGKENATARTGADGETVSLDFDSVLIKEDVPIGVIFGVVLCTLYIQWNLASSK